nr:hypothetical protein [Rickettsia endosymbiont of Oedothorax gibbosus]
MIHQRAKEVSNLLLLSLQLTQTIGQTRIIQNALNPIRIKRYKTIERQLFSLFTYGFDHIKNAFYQSTTAITQLISTLLIPPKQKLFSILIPSLQKL